METPTTSPTTVLTTIPEMTDAPIELRIAGADLLLSGRFDHWEPLVLTSGNDGDWSAKVLFDATSNRVSVAPGPRSDRDLFSFKTTSVKALGPQTYQLTGTLRAADESRQVEALLQSPQAHTPFFVITFPVDRERFGELWSTLEARTARSSADGQDELRPQAWVRPPTLAAA